MFRHDRFVYLQMQKTGGTRIAEILSEVVGGEQVNPKHTSIANPDRPVIGSIRSPWAWYVSLWAFGCQGEGGYRTSLLESYPELEHLYSDVENTVYFREWLRVANGVMNIRYWQMYREDGSLVDAWVRLKFLAHDLIEALEAVGVELSKKQCRDIRKMSNVKTNTSYHLPYLDYYDKESWQLVWNTHEDIVYRHGYSQERLGSYER